jgi:hypothetical protein
LEEAGEEVSVGMEGVMEGCREGVYDEGRVGGEEFER